jgi:two-component system, OmpR family, sensor histidine kinase QseC
MARAAAPRSIRRELLWVLLTSVAVTWVATTVVSYLDTRHEIDELLDAHLAQSASLLIARAGHDWDEIVEHAPQLHRYGRGVAFQLWEKGTILRLHSANAPNGRFSDKSEGFSNVVVDGVRWRVFSAWNDKRRYLVQVGEPLKPRDEIVATMAKNMLFPLLIALPALGLVIWFGINRATRPLQLLNRQVAHRAPDNLAALQLASAPAEVAPLVSSLNRLFERVRASMDNERRFTADAAHELRTPLAALRAQAQVARGSIDNNERDRALDNVISGCDRASHLIDQLLTLARLEPERFQARREPCDLRGVARLVIAELVPSAHARRIEIELHDGPSVAVAGDTRLLGILLRNLVDNAVRYSPPGTAVGVRAGTDGRSAFLSVTDEGPGVAADERAQLGQRFHRLVGTQAPGTGLGLSIAKRIAELHDATIAFAEGEGRVGLVASVTFALADRANRRAATDAEPEPRR